jgi:hypothetical protein
MAAPKNTLTSGLSAADLAAVLSADDDDQAMDDTGDADDEGEGAAPVPPPPPPPAPPNFEHATKAAKSGAAPLVGERVKKGAPPISDSDLQSEVVVRITKAGHNEVHDGSGGRYDWNDEVVLPLAVSRTLEERKLAEIVGNP